VGQGESAKERLQNLKGFLENGEEEKLQLG